MTRTSKSFVVCIDNEGCAAALERRKIYVVLPDAAADKRRYLRVVDESGEDYLYPKAMFVTVDLPSSTRKAVLADA